MTNLCPHQHHSRNAMQRWFLMLLFMVGSVAAIAAGEALPVRPPAAPYLSVPSAPPKPNGNFTAAVAYPKIFFQGAIAVRPVPGTNRLWVLEREGRIWSFEDDPAVTTKTLVLDLNDDDVDLADATPNDGHLTAGVRWWCQGWDDCGLMGLAFHPEFGQANSPNRGYFYLGYQAKSIPPDLAVNAIYRPDSAFAARSTSNRVARFTVIDNSVSADPSSEQILLDQSDPHLWHNGGDIFFDNQGFLYAVNGDGGSTYDVYQNSQRISKRMFSGVLRIDVDWTPSSTRSHAPPVRQPGQPLLYPGYGIPNDNPFVGVVGALEEFYAIGLRSPHRMTYDSATEQILVGDIGQGQREEITSISRGSNHQWGYLEGFANKSVDGSIKESRIPPTYVTGTSVAAGALNVPLVYTAPTADPSLPPGMLTVGDYVRLGSQVRRIAALSAYPYTSVTFESPLTQDVLSSIPLTRTTGFVVSGAVTSTNSDVNAPSGLGTSTIPVSGPGLLLLGSSVSFGASNAYGSYQIIAASDNGTTTTSITVRPRLPASATLTPSTWVDRLTVIGKEQPPIADFGHSGNFALNAIIGGYIYRGTTYPELNGRYIFADNVRGTVYQLKDIGSFSPTIELLFNFPNYPAHDASGYRGLSGFGLDHQGELLICRMQANGGAVNESTGQIWKLIRSSGSIDNPTVIGDPIPTDLAKTGAFLTDGFGKIIIPLQPSPALIPYGVNSPLWSDNAKKTRWISVPNASGKTTGFDPVSEQITFNSTGAFAFPAGTVFVKHFELDDYAFADHRRKLETRLLVRSPNDSVYGVTYKWNAAGTQATLLSSGLEETYTLTDSSGGTFQQTWTYPSRDDCLSCHNTNANHVLGVNSRQLNGTYAYSGVSGNQLETWSRLGLFSNPPSDAIIPSLTKTVDVSNTSASHADRVRSWLDANCSHCHRPGGVHAQFDARFDTPLVDQGLIDGVALNTLGVARARLIAPGYLSRSLVHTRDMSLAAGTKMPPLAKNMVDSTAMSVMEEWILNMEAPLEIELTSPLAGAIVHQPNSVFITANTARYPLINRVEFLINGAVIGSDTMAPYTFAWATTTLGQYSVSAVVYSEDGQTATATPVSITVAAPLIPPMIALTQPSVGTRIPAPGSLTLTAEASDLDGTIALVEFLKNGVVIASATNAPYSVPLYNVGAGTWTFTARATDNDGASTVSAPATVTVSGVSGLSATYWDNMDFTGTSVTRVDAQINFGWGDTPPASGIASDTYTTRWSGTVTAPATGTWTFTTTSDDGIRMSVDGQQIIDNWTNHGPTENIGSIVLTAGVPRTLLVEFFENGGGAVARLEWSGPGQARGLVPQAAFTPPNVAPTVNAGVDLAITLPASATLDATVSDDDLPSGTIMASWTKVSGPGTVTFGDNSATDTTAVFSLAGTYVLRLSVSDGALVMSDDVQVVANPLLIPPMIALTQPSVGISIFAPGSLTLTAEASDLDGTIALVEFLKNGVVIASATNAPYSVPLYNVGAGTWAFTARAKDNDGASTVSAPATVTVSGVSGLSATYWDNIGFTGTSVTRIDALINFDWGDTAPASGIGSDTYTTRWSGTVTAPATGVWTFITTSDDGIRVSIDGQQIINNWTDHPPTENTGTINLTAGVPRTLLVEFFENGGGALARLEWSGPGYARGPVPQAAFTPPNVAPVVNAGDDLAITLPASATLDATVSDDGLPSDTVTASWTKVSGPGTVTFGNSNDTDTTAAFSLAGTHVLRLTVNDGALVTSDDVIVSVTNATGTILREWWTDIAGGAVANLTEMVNYPARPTGSSALTSFEIPINVMDQYGTRVRGYVVPPITGSYVFWISGDDNCQLFLSTSASAVNKVLIASVPGWTNSREWNNYPAQQSVPVMLTAGVEYYIEALHKENGGGDNLAVGWQLPGGVLERPIPGMRLKPFSVASFPLPYVELITPLAGARFTAPESVTLSAHATDADGPITKVELFENGSLIAALTAPPWTTTRTGLSTGTYSYFARATDADGQMSTSAARLITVVNEDQTGLILREWWSGIPGLQVTNLTNAPSFPGAPTGSSLQSLFEAPINWAENYGTRMSGYVVAPTTGDYVFWISGDDYCQLWLSTNDSPASKVLIASVTGWTNSREWTRYPSQQSASINLVAGSRYYIEALHKEAGGGDNLAVGWQLPSGVLERPIPGSRLMPPLVAVASLPVGWSVRRR